MENIIQEMIKKQNKELIKHIAKTLNIDEKYLLEKYYKPSYYCMKINESLNYPIVLIDKNGKNE